MTRHDRYQTLLAELRHMKQVVIAYSGGVDSSFLLHAALEALPPSAVAAVTFATPYMPRAELAEVRRIAAASEATHEIFELPISDAVRNNPDDRCYLCKLGLFRRLKEYAASRGIVHVLDGSNADDAREYRPGMKALRELAIESPMLQAGLSKSDIRSLSRDAGLSTWDAPANACLLTRLPHGVPVEKADLERIDRAEDFLRDHGFQCVRVRCHGTVARIEMAESDMDRLLEKSLRQEVGERFKMLGFRHVAVDLAGYRTGSLDDLESRMEMNHEK